MPLLFFNGFVCFGQALNWKSVLFSSKALLSYLKLASNIYDTNMHWFIKYWGSLIHKLKAYLFSLTINQKASTFRYYKILNKKQPWIYYHISSACIYTYMFTVKIFYISSVLPVKALAFDTKQSKFD